MVKEAKRRSEEKTEKYPKNHILYKVAKKQIGGDEAEIINKLMLRDVARQIGPVRESFVCQ